MTDQLDAELMIGPQAIDAYSRLSYHMWFALAEFVDNSTQSRLNYENLIDDVLAQEGAPLTVNIHHNKLTKELVIEDNSIGMNRDDLIEALKIAIPTKDSKGRSKYGMGMKTAACWIGARWKVITCEFSSGEEWTAEIDVNAIANHGARVPLSVRRVDTSLHYTKIVICDLRRRIQVRSEDTIRTYLSSMYMFDLQPDSDGRVSLKLTYNGEEISPPEEADWDTDPSGQPMKRELPKTTINGKEVSGWFGVLKKGGRKFGGFSFYQNKRQIQGFPHAWKPRSIFGGVDDEGANNLVAQRLTGVILLDGFVVSHTKDAVLFQDDEEEQLEKLLVEETRDYREYAQSRRGKKAQKWSKEKVRDLVEGLRKEFTADELKDAISTANLPPLDTIADNNQQLLRSLQAEDEVAKLEILDDLQVVVSHKETSEWEPYVTFVPAANPSTIHIIINGLHPYYSSLESNDAMEECVQQYIYDAVSEYKTNRLQGRKSPDSVRRLKDSLLRARAHRIDNAGAAERERAEADLYAASEGGAESQQS